MKTCEYWQIESMIDEDMKLASYADVRVEHPENHGKKCGICETCIEEKSYFDSHPEPDYIDLT